MILLRRPVRRTGMSKAVIATATHMLVDRGDLAYDAICRNRLFNPSTRDDDAILRIADAVYQALGL